MEENKNYELEDLQEQKNSRRSTFRPSIPL